MTELTVFAETSDAYIVSTDAEEGDYANARAGTGDVSVVTSTFLQVGQDLSGGNPNVREAFLNWDVSGATGTPTVATPSFWLVNDLSTTDFTLELRLRDWGDTLTIADFVPGASLAALPLLASLATSGIGATGAYKALAAEAALLTAIANAVATDGILRTVLVSSRTTVGNAPSGNELVILSSADETGTTQDPNLVITTVPLAATTSPVNVALLKYRRGAGRRRRARARR